MREDAVTVNQYIRNQPKVSKSGSQAQRNDNPFSMG
jgi:hypothetical protein